MAPSQPRSPTFGHREGGKEGGRHHPADRPGSAAPPGPAHGHRPLSSHLPAAAPRCWKYPALGRLPSAGRSGLSARASPAHGRRHGVAPRPAPRRSAQPPREKAGIRRSDAAGGVKCVGKEGRLEMFLVHDFRVLKKKRKKKIGEV